MHRQTIDEPPKQPPCAPAPAKLPRKRSHAEANAEATTSASSSSGSHAGSSTSRRRSDCGLGDDQEVLGNNLATTLLSCVGCESAIRAGEEMMQCSECLLACHAAPLCVTGAFTNNSSSAGLVCRLCLRATIVSDAPASADGDEASVSAADIAQGIGLVTNECSVCLEPLPHDRVAAPDCCPQHRFCPPCLRDWASRHRICPLDRRPFNQILICSGQLPGAVLCKEGPRVPKRRASRDEHH